MPNYLWLFDGYTYRDLFLIHERTKVSFEEDLLYVVYCMRCCSVLQCVAVCCSVLQCVEVAKCLRVLQGIGLGWKRWRYIYGMLHTHTWQHAIHVNTQKNYAHLWPKKITYIYTFLYIYMYVYVCICFMFLWMNVWMPAIHANAWEYCFYNILSHQNIITSKLVTRIHTPIQIISHLFVAKTWIYYRQMWYDLYGCMYARGWYTFADALFSWIPHLWFVWVHVDRKKPPPGGVSYLLCSLIKNRV